jgi:hypothetical protein
MSFLGTLRWDGRGSAFYRWLGLPLEVEVEFTTAAAAFLVWVELHHVDANGDDKVYAWSRVHIQDPSTFYYGVKYAKVLSYSAIRRHLSGPEGTLEHGTFTVKLSDADGLINSFMTNDHQKWLINRTVVIRAMTESGRATAATPRTLMIGKIKNYEIVNREATLECKDVAQDWLTLAAPQRQISSLTIPDFPVERMGDLIYAPIIYGEVSAHDGLHPSVPTTRGVVPTIWTGPEDIGGTIWQRFVFAGHAVFQIRSAYQHSKDANGNPVYTDISLHADLMAPGSVTTPWAFAFPYRDYFMGGATWYRYSVIYLKGTLAEEAKSGSKPVFLNVLGIETNGDAGGFLIENALDQYSHFLENWVFDNYTSGEWQSGRMYDVGDPLIDYTSLERARSALIGRYGDEPEGGFIISERHEVREFIAEFNKNLMIDTGFNRHGGYLFNAETPVGDSDFVITHHQILRNSFRWWDAVNEFFNQYTYSYAPDYESNGFFLGSYDADDESVEDARLASPKEYELTQVRDDVQAAARIAWKLERTRFPPRYARFSGSLDFLDIELGDIITLTHPHGPGPVGWNGQKVRVTGVEFNPSTLEIAVNVKDLSTAVLVNPDADETFEETMAERNMGGSRQHGWRTARSEPDAYDYRDVYVNWATVPTGWTVRVRASVRTDDPSVTLTPYVREITAGTDVVTGTAYAGQTWQEQTLVLPTEAGEKRYRLRGLATGVGVSAHDHYFFGVLEIVP